MSLRQRSLTTFATAFLILPVVGQGQPPSAPPGAPGGSPPPPYLIQSIEVSGGGYPVQGQTGPLYSVDLGDDCKSPRLKSFGDISAFHPVPRELSGVLAVQTGSEAVLKISVVGCHRQAEPRVSCSWAIHPHRQMVARRYWDRSCRCYPGNESGAHALDCGEVGTVSSGLPARWTGFEGEVNLTLPERSGRYDLVLDCEIEDVPQSPLRFELFAVYAKPQEWVSPPDREWYRRATCWGEGFNAGAPETEVLVAMLSGLYRYGEENWRYGYTWKCGGAYYFPSDHNVWKCENGEMVRIREEPTFNLFLGQEKTADRLVQYQLTGFKELDACAEGSQCYCSWQSLAETSPVCNFADCYTFSEVLTAISATTGIGGLRLYQINGQFNLGFMTRPDARALDPLFRGNVVCDRSLAECYPYEFGSHSVRQRDGLWYDATFQQVYKNPNDAIGLSVNYLVSAEAGSYVANFGDMAIVALGHRYGTWQYYGVLPSRSDTDTRFYPVTEKLKVESVTLEPSPSGKGPFTSLIAHVKSVIVDPGDYVLAGLLYKGEKLVSDRVQLNTSTRPSATLTPEPQDQTSKMVFSGGEIARSREDGPYDVHILVSSEGEMLGKYVFTAGEGLSASHFAGSHVTILGLPEPVVDLRGNGKIGALRFLVPVTVTLPGRYAFELRLANEAGETLAYSGQWKDLKDQKVVELKVDGCQFLRDELPAVYNVTLQVYSDGLTEISSDFRIVDMGHPRRTDCLQP